MGRRSQTGGVTPKGDRIQVEFWYEDKRYRPTFALPPTAANLKYAHRQLADIRQQIRQGTFSFSDWFPGYRLSAPDTGQARTVEAVCKGYISSLEARGELAHSTVQSYRKILANRLKTIKEWAFAAVPFSKLEELVNGHIGSKKTFNNVVSAIRGAWAYGYKDLPGRANPAIGLEGVRIPKREQPKPDPFSIPDAEALIASTRALWGEAQANYEEFRFFTGVRPSEQIAALWADCELSKGTVSISKARVMAKDKSETKNYEDRTIECCPRALAVLTRQRAIWSRLKLEGKISHDHIFFREDGQPFHDLQVQWKRWRRTLDHLKMRAREPYSARHSSISWNLMIGKNFLWVAQQHGHSPAVMLKVYASWLKGASEDDTRAISKAMGYVVAEVVANKGNLGESGGM